MKSITEKLEEVIKEESLKESKNQKIAEFNTMVANMEKQGLLKKSHYTLPLVDTIGKTYYSSTNKRF